MGNRLHAIVEGRVQGVSFRYYTVQQARHLNLAGWVRNNPDRTVEIVAEGDKANLEKMLTFLQSGSPAAQVNDVQVSWSDATGAFNNFSVRYHHR